MPRIPLPPPPALALAALVAAPLFPAIARARQAPPPDAAPNDQRHPAGTRRGDTLDLALELRESTWRLEGAGTPGIVVQAFAEAGGPPSIPGPLLRVVAGTRLRGTVHNALAVRAVVHGLHDHDGHRDSLVLAPGATAPFDFTARTAGTHGYWARTTNAPTLLSRRADSQLVGAFVVDTTGTRTIRDRVLVLTSWDDSVAVPGSPYAVRQLYGINGRSWPVTERLSVRHGDTVTWRVLNLSQHTHPMHLHGTYFRVETSGTVVADTVLPPERQRLVVTDLMRAGGTALIRWVADRPGTWLYHCHATNHVDPFQRLTAHAATPVAGGAAHTGAVHTGAVHTGAAHAGSARTGAPHGDGAAAAHASDHAERGMAGLVLAVTVAPRPGARRAASPPRVARRLRLLVTERVLTDGRSAYAYVLQRDAREPAADSLERPGSLLVLRRGEPTAITVVNRARHATAVHWHGMELESYYDGVAGLSGTPGRTAPMIAPGDSFTAHMTPPRAGTFMVHSHMDELTQLTGGLVAPLVVVAPGPARLPDDDRLLVLADSIAPHMRTPPPMLINGASVPAPLVLRAGTTHRLRILSIGTVTYRLVRLVRDTTVLPWRATAKDGAELPTVAPPREGLFLSPGETIDMLVSLPAGDGYAVEVTAIHGGPAVPVRVPVIVTGR